MLFRSDAAGDRGCEGTGCCVGGVSAVAGDDVLGVVLQEDRQGGHAGCIDGAAANGGRSAGEGDDTGGRNCAGSVYDSDERDLLGVAGVGLRGRERRRGGPQLDAFGEDGGVGWEVGGVSGV